LETVEVPVKARKPGNKRDAGRLRRNGELPGVVYGLGKQENTLAVDARQLRAKVRKLDGSHLIRLKSVDTALDGRIVLIKEVQYHPVTHDIFHLDFYEVDMTRKITVMIPLNYVGRPEGVVQGGVLQPIAREIEVECLPTDIPGQLDVDVSGLEIGDGLRSDDLSLPPNVTIMTLDVPLVNVLAPTVIEESEEEAEAAETTETAETDKDSPAEQKDE
jgi:large subunit ribosomal protein L25